ncbi:MAG: 16S rRNA (adenine(1518)-N(6)/adenine(1519)-N(6))-dimethyltransferase RsmA [Chloroflexi bacterium]|nr:16S rRNA (adenine(1518)-N(6)/adenine(1519)-N(6))-dimethyltransferase RsmA [Chloroflexota bacterium]
MSPQRLGQNFLTDPSVAVRIIHRAGLTSGTAVLEVGPGKGALTYQLASSAASLTVIEFDHALAEALSDRYAGVESVDVVEADARTVDPSSLRQVAGRKYTLVANLPYYAATPIIRNFLESSHPPERMVVMVQREVANEMRAEPGQMGMLSLAVQVYAKVDVLFDVPPEAFTPRPKVTSSVVELTPRPVPLVPPGDQGDFFRLAKAGFRAPRKQLHNSLAKGLNVDAPLARALVESADIDMERRPATLSIDEWKTMLSRWRDAGRPFVVHGTSRDDRKKALNR